MNKQLIKVRMHIDYEYFKPTYIGYAIPRKCVGGFPTLWVVTSQYKLCALTSNCYGCEIMSCGAWLSEALVMEKSL